MFFEKENIKKREMNKSEKKTRKNWENENWGGAGEGAKSFPIISVIIWGNLLYFFGG